MIQAGFFLLLCTGALAVAPRIPGACPTDVEPAKNFDAASLKGLWFEIENHSPSSSPSARCITRNIIHLPNGEAKVIQSQINVSNKGPEKIEKYISAVDAEDASKIFLESEGQKKIPLWIFASDYITFAVLFACADISVANAKSVQIWSRQRDPSPQVLQQAHDILKSYNVGTKALQKTDQTKC